MRRSLGPKWTARTLHEKKRHGQVVQYRQYWFWNLNQIHSRIPLLGELKSIWMLTTILKGFDCQTFWGSELTAVRLKIIGTPENGPTNTTHNLPFRNQGEVAWVRYWHYDSTVTKPCHCFRQGKSAKGTVNLSWKWVLSHLLCCSPSTTTALLEAGLRPEKVYVWLSCVDCLLGILVLQHEQSNPSNEWGYV